MDTAEALAALGLAPGATRHEARAAFRRLVRTAHPDVAGPAGARATARLTAAYAHLRSAPADADGRLGRPPPPAGPGAPPPPPPPADPYQEAVHAEAAAGDTLVLAAPPPEAFAALLEAAGRVGDIAYVDRQLGIIESVVRFEGGPSCSLLITLQGRATATDAFCTLTSIEAAPTPPLAPVVEALLEELAGGA